MKQVWKLIYKIVIFILPFGVIALLLFLHFGSPNLARQMYLENKIQRLVVQAQQHPQVIVAGDSRAEDSFVPQVFASTTGLTSANIGMGGALFGQVYDTLSKYNILNHHKIIAISITSYDIDDGYLESAEPIDKASIDEEKLGLQKLKDLKIYYGAYFDHLEYLKDFFPSRLPRPPIYERCDIWSWRL